MRFSRQEKCTVFRRVRNTTIYHDMIRQVIIRLRHPLYAYIPHNTYDGEK